LGSDAFLEGEGGAGEDGDFWYYFSLPRAPHLRCIVAARPSLTGTRRKRMPEAQRRVRLLVHYHKLNVTRAQTPLRDLGRLRAMRMQDNVGNMLRATGHAVRPKT
jgi:hypothetical protein